MDVYVFLQTRPGAMGTVMNAVVNRGYADRAVAVTGTWDVVARRENVTLKELDTLVVDGIGRLPGVVRSYTAAVIPAELVAKLNPHHLPIDVDLPDLGGLTFAQLSSPVADIVRALHDIKGVHALALLTGEWDLLIQVAGKTIGEIATTVMRDIRGVDGVSRTSTSLILRRTPRRAAIKKPKGPAKRRSPAKKKPASKTARGAARRR